MSDKKNNEQPEEQMIPLPASTVQKVMNTLGTLPYAQVANLMAEVQLAIVENQKQ